MNKPELCRLCKRQVHPIFVGELIGSRVQYFECFNCGYVQTQEPYWLDVAYSQAINVSDTGIMSRNLANADITAMTLLLINSISIHDRVVDSSGGYGILVRLLRDIGIDALWADPFCKNILAKTFEYDGSECKLVTSFEAFEHFVDPIKEIDRLFSLAPNILFSTLLIPSPTPKLDEWYYYGRDHGQHIGFFRHKSLKILANSKDKYFVSDGQSYHLFSEKPVNSLLWKVALKSRKLFSAIARKRLETRTFSDHLSVTRYMLDLRKEP